MLTPVRNADKGQGCRPRVGVRGDPCKILRFGTERHRKPQKGSGKIIADAFTALLLASCESRLGISLVFICFHAGNP